MQHIDQFSWCIIMDRELFTAATLVMPVEKDFAYHASAIS